MSTQILDGTTSRAKIKTFLDFKPEQKKEILAKLSGVLCKEGEKNFRVFCAHDTDESFPIHISKGKECEDCEQCRRAFKDCLASLFS